MTSPLPEALDRHFDLDAVIDEDFEEPRAASTPAPQSESKTRSRSPR
jgi:hypothetical protein